MGKQWFLQTIVYYSAIKQEELWYTTAAAATCIDLKGIKLNDKKTIPKGYLRYDATYITFLKWQN